MHFFFRLSLLLVGASIFLGSTGTEVKATNNTTSVPTSAPTRKPRNKPTQRPRTRKPATKRPSMPSVQPTRKPILIPTTIPSKSPQINSSNIPSRVPTIKSTSRSPVAHPTTQPSPTPFTRSPILKVVVSSKPRSISIEESSSPSDSPESCPSGSPTNAPTDVDSPSSRKPSTVSSRLPFTAWQPRTRQPYDKPTRQPTTIYDFPTSRPRSLKPTSRPTPTWQPITRRPTQTPINSTWLYSGYWDISDELEYPGISTCPDLPSLVDPEHQPNDYSKKNPYHIANYIPPDGFVIPSIEESIAFLTKRLKRIPKVAAYGDSVTLGLYNTLPCYCESFDCKINVEARFTRFGVVNPCGCDSVAGCLDRENVLEWENDRSADIVMFQVGTWFVPKNLPCDSWENIYAQAIRDILPSLQIYVGDGKPVYWIGLFPNNLPRFPANITFTQSNEIAQKVLRGSGIKFINPYKVIKDRFLADPYSKCDVNHPCGYGPHSVYKFIDQIVLYLAAQELGGFA